MTDTFSVLLNELPLPGCALLTLNRPEARNTLSDTLQTCGGTGFRLVGGRAPCHADIWIFVLTGVGDAFCTGLDLKDLGTLSRLGARFRRLKRVRHHGQFRSDRSATSRLRARGQLQT